MGPGAEKRAQLPETTLFVHASYSHGSVYVYVQLFLRFLFALRQSSSLGQPRVLPGPGGGGTGRVSVAGVLVCLGAILYPPTNDPMEPEN